MADVLRFTETHYSKNRADVTEKWKNFTDVLHRAMTLAMAV